MGRQKLEAKEHKKQVEIYVQEKVIDKLTRKEVQRIATTAVNIAYHCNGSCEICICGITVKNS